MTQNVRNRGNLGQVAALKEGYYTARTLLDVEPYSQTARLEERTLDGR
ncbi:MAG TPA: hypothetical protein VI251_09655 [Pseudolabrys sp.]